MPRTNSFSHPGRSVVFGPLVLLLFLSSSVSVHAQSGAGSTSLNFEKLGMGARAAGMGEAFTAVADDATAMYWNPAGLVLARGSQLSFTHGQWLDGVNDEYIALSQNLWKWGAIGLSGQFISSGTIPGSLVGGGGVYGGVGPDVSYSSSQISFAYAQRLGNIVPGGFFENSLLGAKISSGGENISGLNTSALTLDVGYMHEIVSHTLFFGTVLSNVGADVKSYAEPLHYKFAGSLQLGNLMAQKDHNILAMETTGYIDTGFGFKIGDEYRLNFDDNAVALRMGFRAGNQLDSVTNLTTGVGVYHDFGDVEASLDYAFVPYSALGDTHRVTINLIAGNKPIPVKVTLGPDTSFILGQASMDIPVTVKHGAPIRTWKMEILNDQNQAVKTVTGHGDPADHFQWDGKDEKGELVPKGRYTLKLEVEDEDGQTDKAAPRTVRARWQPKKVKYQYTYQVQGDLLFKSGSSELRKEGYAVIQKAVADIQAKYPGSDIQVAGHTDNVKVMPGRKYKSNQELSQARAESVRDFLVQNGVDPNHLSAQGYGDKKPIVSNDTWAGKRKNRRVELVVSGASDVTSEDLIPKGKEAMAAKHYKEALDIFEKALESDDRDPEAYALSGDCLWALGDKEKAIERYRLALKYDPNNQTYKDWIDAHAPNPLRDLLAEANRAVAQKDHKTALAALQRALKYDDHNASIYELMGNSHLALKDEDQAIADYKKSLELDPTNQALKDKLRKLAPTPAEVAGDLTQEAYGNMRANKFQEALPVLLKAIETDPQNAKAYQLAGNCYWQLGDKMKGVVYCRKSLEIEPNNPGLKQWMTAVEAKLQTASAAEDLVNQGRDTMRKGKYKEALPTLLKAIETYPKNPRAYQLTGNCYWQLGEKAKGLDYCRRALELDPNNTSLAAWVKAAEAKLKGAAKP